MKNNHAAVAHLSPAGFQEEVYKLLLRYRDGTGREDSSRSVNMRNHWTTPPEVMHVLKRHLGITQERFASPLNFCDDIPQHWSCHERDQVFAARWDSYSCQWRGMSQANPEYEHEEMSKAVKWALTSGQMTTHPVLTVFILPAWDTGSQRTSYMQYLDKHPDRCHVLMRIKREHFAFCTPDAWKGFGTHAGCPKWDVNVLLVGNAAGMQNAANVSREALCQDMVQCLQQLRQQRLSARTDAQQTDLAHLNFRPVRTNLATTTVATTKRFRKLPANKYINLKPYDHLTTQGVDVRGKFAAQHPLLVDASALVYTDGSVRTASATVANDSPNETEEEPNDSLGGSRCSVAGSGIFVPSHLYPASGQAVDGECVIHNANAEGIQILVQPSQQSHVITINRAEGAAIWYALKHGLGTSIATDSATLLYQIKNMLMKPHSMRHSHNKALLQDIVEMIRTSPNRIRLYKVKAHSGIPGNEYADEAARQAATNFTSRQSAAADADAEVGHTQTTQNTPTCTVTCDPPTQLIFWPWATQQLRHGPDDYNAEGNAQTQQPPQPHTPVQDLGSKLKQAVHAASKIGYSNVNSVYFQAWQNIINTADGPMSNAFMHDCDITQAKERKLTLQYRSGGLCTAKMRYRMKIVKTPNCELCGQPDGGHHSLSGCPELKGLYTNRHNEAGKLIMRYIMKGAKGGTIVMHDVGKHDDHTPEQQQSAPAARIPAWVYTTGHRRPASEVNAPRWNGYRPDILLVSGGKKTPVQERHVHTVEIKYCRDTDPVHQQDRARLQHEQLQEHLQRIGYRKHNIHHHIILLGVGGVVYKDMYNCLHILGVPRQRTKRLAKKLSRHAVTYVKIIMETKRNQEYLKKQSQQNRTGIG
jgi:ribonuclease HI